MNGYKPLGMTSEADNYIAKRDDLKKICKSVFEACDGFLESYKDFLSDSERCVVMKRAWGFQYVSEYKRKILSEVLFGSYKVFDDSHKRYIQLLNVVRVNNPEWIESVIRDHENKIKQCKVSVYPLEEALTA